MALYAEILRTSGGTTGTQTFGQMAICIFDAATGQPTNGNNCQVSYTQNINGVITNNTVIVPGLQYTIYSGELSDTSTTTPFYTQFEVLGAPIPGTATVSPSADDLNLVSVIPTPVSANGATDGSITVNATSSFPAIQYSLNNSTWQNSNVFTGLSAGAGTVYVRDQNSGTAHLGFTIGTVGNVLTADPSVDFGNGNLARWNSAFNPVVFKYQRKDFQVTSITVAPDGINILVSINANVSAVKPRSNISTGNVLQPTVTSAGDYVYLQTANYSGSYEVLVTNSGSLVVNCPFVANDGSGFVNINSLRPYYQLQTQITYVDPVSNKFKTITSTNTPDSAGYCRVDLSNFLQSLVQAKDNSNYSAINYRDMQLSASYTVKYAEVWAGNNPTWVSITRPYYVVYSAKQLGDKYGGSLAEYVPFLLGYQPAKWITDFVNPVYNYLFPFDLGFIFSEYITSVSPFYVITLLDINQNPLVNQNVNTSFLLNQDGGFQLNQDGSKFIIAAQALSKTPIVQNVGLNRLLINFQPPALCYYFSVQLQYTASGTTYNLTQKLICRIDQNTPDQQVYLRWIGLCGAWQYYTFAYNQEISLDVSEPVTIKKYVQDWANEDTLEDIIKKNAGQKMNVFAENISQNDIKGLQSIKYSPKVQILTSTAPIKWQTVIVAAGTFNEYETMYDVCPFSLTLNLPTKNIQSQ